MMLESASLAIEHLLLRLQPLNRALRVAVEHHADLFPDTVEHKNPFITVGWKATILLNFRFCAGFNSAEKTTQDVDFLFLDTGTRE